MHIAHVTSVHVWKDTRIFQRMCRHLASLGFQVSLYAADRTSWEAQIDGVRVCCVARRGGRARRMGLLGPQLVLRALRDEPDLLHFHDPELLLATTLTRLRQPVVFDVHEDVARQIEDKDWLPSWCQTGAARAYTLLESTFSRLVSAIVVANPAHARRFSRARELLCVRNFPLRSELPPRSGRPRSRNLLAYVGGIATVRGALVIAEAIEQLRRSRADIRCVLAGPVLEEGLRDRLSKTQGIELPGFVSRAEVYELLSEAEVGLCLLQPIPRFFEAYPTKLFEYMASELPVVASDFELYRPILSSPPCGVMVDPTSPSQVAEVVGELLSDASRARRLGVAGRDSVEESYTWEHDGGALAALYCRLLRRPMPNLAAAPGERDRSR